MERADARVEGGTGVTRFARLTYRWDYSRRTLALRPRRPGPEIVKMGISASVWDRFKYELRGGTMFSKGTAPFDCFRTDFGLLYDEVQMLCAGIV